MSAGHTSSLLWTALRRCLPKHLRSQILILLSTVMLSALAVLYAVSSHRAETTALAATQRWAEAVAATAASAGAQPLALRDYALLESTLRDIARLPGVMRIDVIEANGQPLMALHAQPGGKISVSYKPLDALPPANLNAADTLTVPVPHGSDSVPALQVWTPIDPDHPLGRVGVLFSQDIERTQLVRLQHESLLWITLGGAISLLTLYFFLMVSLKPLQRLARFSRSLGTQVGQRLDQRAGSEEVRELTEALNDASQRLNEQLASIRSSEARTHAILDATPDAIVGLDAQACVTLLNPAACSMFGVELRDIEGQPLSALLPDLIPEMVAGVAQDGRLIRAGQGRMARMELTALRRDGTSFPVELVIAHLEDDTGLHYTCVMRDVTDQRWIDAMLRLFNRAVECTTNGLVIADIKQEGQPLFYVNPAFEKITGYSSAEAIGQSFGFLHGTDQAQPEIDVLRQAMARGDTATVVLRNYRKDGSLFFNELSIAPVPEPDGTISHYVGVQSDVTERERARVALAERNARLNAVFDLSPDGFVVFDRHQKLVYCNPAFVQMTGWDGLTENTRLSLQEFDHYFETLCDNLDTYVPVTGTRSREDEGPELLQLLRPERRTLSRVKRLNLGGEEESILYFRDVTRETEVDRMKSEFLTTAAHELRTPMVSIFGFAELMLNRPLAPERQRDVMQTIHKQSKLLVNMVNELLDLARIEARQGKDFHLQTEPIGPLIEETVGAIRMQGDERSVQCEVTHADTLLRIDHDKARQALTNVLSNAFKYSPQGGEVRLQTLLRQHQGEAQLGVRVSDQGIGMTPEQQARLFERFYRADPSGNIPGTGLGMSLVKEIIELHGGHVEVQSQAGQGTQVTLWLPVPQVSPLSRPMALQVGR